MSDQHPLTLDYYLSHPVNAYSEDNTFTQEDANEQAEIEFKQDCIIYTIGKPECKYNIDNFWNEIFSSFHDKDQMRNFLIKVMNKLIDEYNLELMKQYVSDYFSMDNFSSELLGILKFFETEQCSKVIADIYYSRTLNELINNKDELNQYLDLYYDLAIQKFSKYKGSISPWIYYIFNMMPKEDFINLVMKLIDRYTNETLTEILILRGSKNAKN